MSVALGTVFMTVGALFEVLDLSASALASLIVAFVYIEIGSPYTWLVWLATSLLSFVFFPGSMVWLTYLTFFGVYPILKGYIEKAPRPLWLPLKLIFGNLALGLMVLGCSFALGVDFFGDVSVISFLPPTAVYVALWILLNVLIVLYDVFIVTMVRFYYARIRPRLERALK